MTALPVWVESALQEHAPGPDASEAASARFDALRERVKGGSVLVATELASALKGVSDDGKRAVFAQAVWAGKYYGIEGSGTDTAREAVREAARLNDEIRARLDELVTLARQHERLIADNSLTGGPPDMVDCLEALQRSHPAWALITGLSHMLGVSKNTSQALPGFADVLEALSATDFEKPGHWLGDTLSSRKATADRTRVLLHALARLNHHPHLPSGFELSNAGVAALAHVVFGANVDVEAVRKLRRRNTTDA